MNKRKPPGGWQPWMTIQCGEEDEKESTSVELLIQEPARSILEGSAPLPYRQQLQVVKVRLGDLVGPCGGSIGQALGQAQRLGLRLCPPSLGERVLRVLDASQGRRKRNRPPPCANPTMIAMEPVPTDRGGVVLSIGQARQGRRQSPRPMLGISQVGGQCHLEPSVELVFVVEG